MYFTFGTEEYACFWWEFLAYLHFIPRYPHGLPWHACVEYYRRLFLNKTQLLSAENIIQSSASVWELFALFLLLRAFTQTSARKFTIQLWNFIRSGITDGSPSGDNSALVCHLSTSPNTQGMVSHRHKTYLSSKRFLLALSEKQGKGTDCNGSSLTLFSISYFAQNPRHRQRFPTVLPKFWNNCVILQDRVEHVDDQKRVQWYSYSLVYFAAFQLCG